MRCFAVSLATGYLEVTRDSATRRAHAHRSPLASGWERL